MSLALALLVCAAAPSADRNANLDFSAGSLEGWEGDGFYVTTGSGHGPSLLAGVCSSDRDCKGRTALLHRTFVVPPGAGVLRCSACTIRPRDCPSEGQLDVVVFAAGRKIIPKRVRKGLEFDSTNGVLPPLTGRPREYVWDLSSYAGHTLRIVLMDEDKRPGCHLVCSGFRIVSADKFDQREFSRFMVRLSDQHKLAPVARFDSKHFLALSNADDEFTQRRLNNCELIYDLFFEHFGKYGFRLREPAGKLMVAVFDSQAGFEAYLGHAMPTSVTGVYNKKTNRLLVYDYGQNRDFVAAKRQRQQTAHRIWSDLDRIRYIETSNRRLQDFRTEANIGTVMHEVAHQLSFNTGMLNREGDVPLWLAEGLACYCEATSKSAWQGIGESNPERIITLSGPFHGRGRLLPLRDLIEADRWMQERPDTNRILMGYAQGWALFKMLMEERPQQLRRYLALIYDRRTPDHRLDDFARAFGADLPRLELRHKEYIKETVERYSRPRR